MLTGHHPAMLLQRMPQGANREVVYLPVSHYDSLFRHERNRVNRLAGLRANQSPSSPICQPPAVHSAALHRQKAEVSSQTAGRGPHARQASRAFDTAIGVDDADQKDLVSQPEAMMLNR